jgi:peptide/nickel transport system permease protein
MTDSLLRRALENWNGRIGLAILIAFIAIAIGANFLSPKDPYATDLRNVLVPPGTNGYVLGTDEVGRDLLSRTLYGARVSLLVAISALCFGLILGLPLGILSGFLGGRVDTVLMRVVDILLSLPRLLIAIVLVATYGIGFGSLIIAIGFTDIAIFARVSRSSVLSLREQEFVHSARALGVRTSRLFHRYLLPNIMGPVMVQITFSLASVVLITGGLSFLGLGVQYPTPEWGAMIAAGRNYMRESPHIIIVPGIALGVVVLGINLLGDALRDAADPRLFRSSK